MLEKLRVRFQQNAAPSIFADQKVNRVVHQTVICTDLQKEDISTTSIRKIKDIIGVYLRSQTESSTDATCPA